MLAISIHAPVKGATRGAPLTRRTRWHFNPRSREGSDYASITPSAIVQHFNPRSREGSDIVGPVPVHGVLEFQSTLP